MDIVFLIFIAAFALQIFYYSYFFLRLAYYKKPVSYENKEHQVSVIISARNEERNLKEHLPLILEQDYPTYEVIVVNDNSTDGTAIVVENLIRKYGNLKLVNNLPETGGKKRALTLGISKASYDYLLFTDADCRPASTTWIRNMLKGFHPGKDIILGFSPYRKKDGFLNKWIRFETIYTALQYLSFALGGIPYMGVGRNLAYKKNLFLSSQGFEDHLDLLSGDDDLFVNRVAFASNTGIVFDRESYMYSNPKSTWKQWLRQKIRHLTTGYRYRLKHQLLLGMLAFSHLAFYVSILIMLASGYEIKMILALFLARALLQIFVFERVLRQSRSGDLLSLVPLFDFIYLIFYFILAPAALKRNRHIWE